MEALRPLLNRFGNETRLTLILFTLDETVYSRELAPLAGHYPCLRLGPPWWFHDSPEGMRRFREQATETAGFYNTVGFNDDTRAFLSIPARHDVARRMDAGFLARLVAEHRIDENEAAELARGIDRGAGAKGLRTVRGAYGEATQLRERFASDVKVFGAGFSVCTRAERRARIFKSF